MDEELVKFYKDLTIKKLPDFDIINKALRVAQQFVQNKKRILVGGQAIDFALKLKGDHIYKDELFMDVDIASDMYFQDAYALATILKRTGFTDISVINALHPSTMKVRVNFQVILDITYVPTNIIEVIPTLWYKGYSIVHPHYQMIDMHRSLSYPYENAPRETILDRPIKDMTRYDKLYKYYPLRILGPVKKIELKEVSIPLSMIENQCISGFAALTYWIQEAKKLGFQTNINLGSFSMSENELKCQIPVGTYIPIYSDNIKDFYLEVKKWQNGKESKFYNRFLDKLPKRIVIGEFEIFDNNQKIAAHRVNSIYVTNMQVIMMYFLINYIILAKVQQVPRNHAYYVGYLLSKDVFKWAADEYINDKEGSPRNISLERFLPTALTYGERNLNDAYIVSKYKFDLKNKEVSDMKKDLYAQPKHLYDRDLAYGKAPKKYFDFDVSQSYIFAIDGSSIDEEIFWS